MPALPRYHNPSRFRGRNTRHKPEPQQATP